MQLNAGQEWDTLIQAMSLPASATGSMEIDNRVANHRPPQLAKALTGCNHARAALLRQIEDPCYRFCLALLGSPDAARDATQETALRVLRSLGRYKGDAAFQTWALSIALNVCREQRRRRRWFSLPDGFGKQDTSPGPSRQAQSREDDLRLTGLIQRLPARQREVVTLRYLQQLSTKETAIAMRCAEGTVKATLAKALVTLRAQWEQADG